MTVSRREFITWTGAAATGAELAPGLRLIELADARALDQPATAANRWGLLIDPSKCAEGCSACVTACNTENGITKTGNPATDPQWIRTVKVEDPQTGYAEQLPVMCQHCAEPPCVDVCPTGASFKRIDGIVLVDKHICIGCRYCMMACPYKARSFIHEDITEHKTDVPRGKGTVESCTLCVQKVDRGDGATVCAEACAKEGHRAILFGDLKDSNSEIAKELAKYPTTELRADLNLNTGVRYRQA